MTEGEQGKIVGASAKEGTEPLEQCVLSILAFFWMVGDKYSKVAV